MWSRSSSEDCPFCGEPVPPRKWACAACNAEKRTRKGMSPASFRVFFGVWAALAGALMLLAVWIAIVPWTPRGEPPDYALWLVGVREPVAPSGGCKVEVIDANGRRQEVVMPGGCDAVAPAAVLRAPVDAARSEAPAIDPTTRRMAAMVHSAASLLGGLLLCWLLQRLLRGFFLRRTPPSWVRRTA